MHGNGIHVSFDRFTEFEQALSKFTGAPYVVLTDCCTHAIELFLRYKTPGPCVIPAHTYLSIPMTFHKLDIPYYYDTNNDWQYEYRLVPSNIWDSARAFDRGMYRTGALQCLSFGHSKRLEIGHGGAILTNKKHEYDALRRMAYDGRDLNISPWQDQKVFHVGYHYKPSIEDCEKGIHMLAENKLKTKESQLVEYPNLLDIQIQD